MGTLRNCIVLIGLVAHVCAALASTDCKSTVERITIEVGAKDKSGAAVELSSGVTFFTNSGSAHYGSILATAETSMTLGESLTARFAADGVRCDTKARRTDLVALVRGNRETSAMAPISSTTTVVTTPSADSAASASVPQK